MTTLLVRPQEFTGDSASVGGDAFRHLFRARRLDVGERLRVVDGSGAARWATVGSIGRRRADLDLGTPAPANESARRVEVFVAPPKVGRASWMIEKLTEVGVSAVYLWATDRSTRSYGETNLERLRRVAAAAVEQCERSRIPSIDQGTWEQGLARLADFEQRWLLTPGGGRAPAPASETASIAVLVGPEGGWTDGELADLRGLPCSEVGLGPTVLRVETAAVVGAAPALLA